MLIRKINGFTAEIGKDQGYLSLPIRQTIGDSIINGQTIWVEKTETAWEPTPGELESLNKGASIVVQQLLFGQPFPPIFLYTESVDEQLSGLDRMKQDLGDSLGRAIEFIGSVLDETAVKYESTGEIDNVSYQQYRGFYQKMKELFRRMEAL